MNWLKVFRCKLKDFNRVTRGKQHNSRCNCTSNNYLMDTSLNYPPKTHLYKQVHEFYSFDLLNFYSDFLMLKVRTAWVEKAKIMQGCLVKKTETVVANTPPPPPTTKKKKKKKNRHSRSKTHHRQSRFKTHHRQFRSNTNHRRSRSKTHHRQSRSKTHHRQSRSKTHQRQSRSKNTPKTI